MHIATTRFGEVEADDGDILTFVDGLIGMEDCRRWVLLGDAENRALGWMQCFDRPEVALAVVSPRRFVPDYQIRVSRRDVNPLALEDPAEAHVLTIVSQTGGALSLNLKAPLLINIDAQLGRQIIARDDHQVQYLLLARPELRKTA
jgi:flagellar assembly factor FliW